MAQQHVDMTDCPLIAATYAARATELIYRHLLGQLPFDEDIDKIIGVIMGLKPLKIGPAGIVVGSQTPGGSGPNTSQASSPSATPPASPGNSPYLWPSTTPQGSPISSRTIPLLHLTPPAATIPTHPKTPLTVSLIGPSTPSPSPSVSSGSNTAHSRPGTAQGNGTKSPTGSITTPLLITATPGPSNRTPSPEEIPGTLAYEIRREYTELKNLEFERYLEHIRQRFERRGRPDERDTVFKDPDIATIEYRLDQYVGIVQKELKLKLADRTKLISAPRFNRRTKRNCCIGLFFWLWLGLAIALFWFSLLDNECILVFQKFTDYNTTIPRNTTNTWCFLGLAQKQTDLILNKDTEPIVSYLADRTWRMSIFFNVAVLIFASLLAKIATNFVNGQPGAAGFRLNGPMNILGFRFNFKHKDLELSKDPCYHIQRHFEAKNIYIRDYRGRYGVDGVYEGNRIDQLHGHGVV